MSEFRRENGRMFIQTHLRVPGYYCRHGYPHGGPCPMIPTLGERFRRALRAAWRELTR